MTQMTHKDVPAVVDLLGLTRTAIAQHLKEARDSINKRRPKVAIYPLTIRPHRREGKLLEKFKKAEVARKIREAFAIDPDVTISERKIRITCAPFSDRITKIEIELFFPKLDQQLLDLHR